MWTEADDEGKWGILETVFARFVVDRQRIVDVEVRLPYSWLLRLKPEVKESHVVGSEIGAYSSETIPRLPVYKAPEMP